MKRKKLDEVFHNCKQKLLPKSEQDTIAKLRDYTNGSDTITLEQATAFAYMESIKYTNELVYNLFAELCVDDE